jgi:hypothetical protein
MAIETVQIMPSDPASQGPFVVINKSAFDPLLHRLYPDETPNQTDTPPEAPAKRGPGRPPKPKEP